MADISEIQIGSTKYNVKDAKIYDSGIFAGSIPNGEITGSMKQAFIVMRAACSNSSPKLILFGGDSSAGPDGSTRLIGQVESYGSQFKMYLMYKGALCYITADPSDTTWTATWTSSLSELDTTIGNINTVLESVI